MILANPTERTITELWPQAELDTMSRVLKNIVRLDGERAARGEDQQLADGSPPGASEATPSVTDTAADLRRALAGSPAHVLVAEADGRIVGLVIGTFDGWRGNIYRLAVHPGYRGQGIARSLVAAAEERLSSQGAKRITALVEKDHPWAVGFWEAVGYGVDRRIERHVRNLI
jgi:ribosomal protein S18 acetylase RimI-like enzyme